MHSIRLVLGAVGASTALLIAPLAIAQTPPAAPAAAPAPTPEHTFAYNVGVTSQYLYRGLSQSNYRPALQGGVDYTHSSGFYAGIWASSITWLRDFGLNTSRVEIDTYLGYKQTVGDFTYDVGYLRYNYPGTRKGEAIRPDTDEIYIAGTFKEYTLKYSHGISNVFGTIDSKNTGYFDLTAAWPLVEGLTLTAHIGHQKFTGVTKSDSTYTDWKLELGKDFGQGISGGIGYTGTNADEVFYKPISKKFTGKDTGYIFVKYTF
jgi:uncharacterized protein (TIGR02001 family)